MRPIDALDPISVTCMLSLPCGLLPVDFSATCLYAFIICRCVLYIQHISPFLCVIHSELKDARVPGSCNACSDGVKKEEKCSDRPD
jgi:hypothetical protein